MEDAKITRIQKKDQEFSFASYRLLIRSITLEKIQDNYTKVTSEQIYFVLLISIGHFFNYQFLCLTILRSRKSM